MLGCLYRGDIQNFNIPHSSVGKCGRHITFVHQQTESSRVVDEIKPNISTHRRSHYHAAFLDFCMFVFVQYPKMIKEKILVNEAPSSFLSAKCCCYFLLNQSKGFKSWLPLIGIVIFFCPGCAASPEAEMQTAPPATSALEEMALYSNKRKLRQGRRSLETAVPT